MHRYNTQGGTAHGIRAGGSVGAHAAVWPPYWAATNNTGDEQCCPQSDAAGVAAAAGVVGTVPVALKMDHPLHGMIPGGSGDGGGPGGMSDAVSPACQPAQGTIPGGSGGGGGPGTTSEAVSPIFQPAQANTPGGRGVTGGGEPKMEPVGPAA